jgi:hypothetical protein
MAGRGTGAGRGGGIAVPPGVQAGGRGTGIAIPGNVGSKRGKKNPWLVQIAGCVCCVSGSRKWYWWMLLFPSRKARCINVGFERFVYSLEQPNKTATATTTAPKAPADAKPVIPSRPTAGAAAPKAVAKAGGWFCDFVVFVVR